MKNNIKKLTLIAVLLAGSNFSETLNQFFNNFINPSPDIRNARDDIKLLKNFNLNIDQEAIFFNFFRIRHTFINRHELKLTWDFENNSKLKWKKKFDEIFVENMYQFIFNNIDKFCDYDVSFICKKLSVYICNTEEFFNEKMDNEEISISDIIDFNIEFFHNIYNRFLNNSNLNINELINCFKQLENLQNKLAEEISNLKVNKNKE